MFYIIKPFVYAVKTLHFSGKGEFYKVFFSLQKPKNVKFYKVISLRKSKM